MLSAVLQLREFDSCREVPGFDGVIREVWVLDPVFGPVVFTAVLVGEIVEIASFRTDPDYWDTVNSDP